MKFIKSTFLIILYFFLISSFADDYLVVDEKKLKQLGFTPSTIVEGENQESGRPPMPSLDAHNYVGNLDSHKFMPYSPLISFTTPAGLITLDITIDEDDTLDQQRIKETHAYHFSYQHNGTISLLPRDKSKLIAMSFSDFRIVSVYFPVVKDNNIISWARLAPGNIISFENHSNFSVAKLVLEANVNKMGENANGSFVYLKQYQKLLGADSDKVYNKNFGSEVILDGRLVNEGYTEEKAIDIKTNYNIYVDNEEKLEYSNNSKKRGQSLLTSLVTGVTKSSNSAIAQSSRTEVSDTEGDSSSRSDEKITKDKIIVEERRTHTARYDGNETVRVALFQMRHGLLHRIPELTLSRLNLSFKNWYLENKLGISLDFELIDDISYTEDEIKEFMYRQSVVPIVNTIINNKGALERVSSRMAEKLSLVDAVLQKQGNDALALTVDFLNAFSKTLNDQRYFEQGQLMLDQYGSEPEVRQLILAIANKQAIILDYLYYNELTKEMVQFLNIPERTITRTNILKVVES